ncbi:MAG TPA: Gfo/Idh/MocA family oxidoreductase, partial [Pyrinomonadaceae bacterium]|nr:Gfo/Idh/MocA family oxidoreductase [Pyrinomonadaceae bacterium]
SGRAPIRLGLVGGGRVAETRHLPALARVSGGRVVAAADVDPVNLERVARRFDIERRHADFRAMLREEELDAVAVCVPPALHAEVALAALDAGKHLFVEKPLALRLEDCDLLIERARAAGVCGMVGFNLRWHRLVCEAREAVRRGEIGELRMLRTVFTARTRAGGDRFTPTPAWRARPEEGGGALFDLGVHHFDLLGFLLGDEVEEVSALGPSDEDADACAFTARTSRGVLVSSVFCEGTAECHELELYGTRGRLRVSPYRFDGLERTDGAAYAGAPCERLRGVARTVRELPRALLRARAGGDLLNSYAAEWEHFFNAIRRDAAPAATLEDGRRALALALAAARAVGERRAVKLLAVSD